MESVVAALQRYGGVIAAPRRTVAELPTDQGRSDGAILGSLYLLTVATYALIESFAGLFATRDFNAVMMLASTLGRALVVPIVVLVAAETLLGADRRYRRGLSLVPMLAVAVLAHELAALGVTLPAYGPEILGGALGIALIGYIRGAVAPVKEAK